MNTVSWVGGVLGIAAASLSGVAGAADAQFYGPLRGRDLTTFGFLRLDMRPAYAVAIEPGSWALEAELGYQNTWALSPQVEQYLTSLESSGRRRLGAAELQAIQDLPGENYLLDVESAAFDLTFHYKFSTHWTGYFIASAVSYQGGFLDGVIEGFHDTFGFSSFGRPAISRNAVNVIFDLKSASVTAFNPPTNGGLTDPTVGLRYTGLPFSDTWKLTIEAAVKAPVAGRRTLLSTGSTDYGVQASLQQFGQHHAWYINLAAVYYDNAVDPIPSSPQITPTLIVGYERQLTDRTNLNLQGYISESVYSREQTDLDDLLGEKYQVSLGLRHRVNRFLITFAVTENLQNVNNTPDIGFQLGVAYVPARVIQQR